MDYFLKPNNYHINDWNWILKKFDKKIHTWYNRKLTLGVDWYYCDQYLQTSLYIGLHCWRSRLTYSTRFDVFLLNFCGRRCKKIKVHI